MWKTYARKMSPGMVLLVFGILVYSIIPSQIAEDMDYGASSGLSPSFFPRMATLSIIFLAVCIQLQSYIHIAKQGKGIPKAEIKEKLVNRNRMMATVAIYGAYAYAVGVFGFILLTPFVLGFMMWYWGVKQRYLIPIISLSTTFGLYWFFRGFMDIYLPGGILLH